MTRDVSSGEASEPVPHLWKSIKAEIKYQSHGLFKIDATSYWLKNKNKSYTVIVLQ